MIRILTILNLWPPFDRPVPGALYLAAQDAFVPGAVQQSVFVFGAVEQDGQPTGATVQDSN